VSPVDGIKSHFKTSYGLVVKLLETRSLEACKELIQRGFGAYLLTQKLQRKSESEDVSSIESFREVLQKYTLKTSRDYLKLARRLEKERSNCEFLEQKLYESSAELVQAIADYMPLGVGIHLRDGSSGFFLGDTAQSTPSKTTKFKGFGVITAGSSAQLLVVRKEHIMQFAEPEDCLPLNRAQALVEVLRTNAGWDEYTMAGCTSPALRSNTAIEITTAAAVAASSDLLRAGAAAEALHAVRNAQPFPLQDPPGSLLRQRQLVRELEKELEGSEIHSNGQGGLVLEALRYAASLRDPMGFINGSPKGAGGGGGTKSGDFFAWRMFQASLQVLRQFNAFESGGSTATMLGQVVGSLSADNELWLALGVLHPAVQQLAPEVR
jgi:hypothetical protein